MMKNRLLCRRLSRAGIARRIADGGVFACVAAGALALVASMAWSLTASASPGSFFLDPQPRAETPGVVLDTGPRLSNTSLTLVIPPEAREYRKHDLVTIIINESSIASYEQSLETEKDYKANGTIRSLPSLRHLLEMQLRGSSTTPVITVGADGKREFTGDGSYERRDRFTTRITGTILEVKPNGVLLVEAKSSRTNDDETATLVISGLCRPEDITGQNTVQSNQMANLTILVRHEGEVRNAAKKGILSKVFDAILAI